jgi:large subunit ribosomal protein L25
VAGERIKLEVSERTELGSAESRRLRKQGIVPGVLYGRVKPIAIAVGERELRAALTTPAGSHVVLDVAVGSGSSHSAILKDYQRDKVRGGITHIDLQEVRLDQPIHATVPLHLTGESVGAKEGGVLNQVLTELNVEALPMEVPASLDFDISALHLGESAHLSQVTLPDGVTLLDDGETVFVTVTQPTREVEPEPEEGAEGEEGVEGEAAEGEEPTAEGDDEAAAESSSDSEE